jgi:hypothetical protein
MAAATMTSATAGISYTGKAGQETRASLPEAVPFAVDDSEKWSFDGANLVAFVSIAALYLGLRTWRLTSYGLYGDETFSARVSVSEWPQLIELVVFDVVHPPLSFLHSAEAMGADRG